MKRNHNLLGKLCGKICFLYLDPLVNLFSPFRKQSQFLSPFCGVNSVIFVSLI